MARWTKAAAQWTCCLIAAAFLLFFSSASMAQLLEPTESAGIEDAPLTQQVEVVPGASDDQIAARLSDILRATEWYEGPQVTVTDGVAFLDGTTDSQLRRNWAGSLAEKTQGVVAVVNRIVVDADVGSTFGRAWVESAGLAQQALQAWPLAVLAAVVIVAAWLVSVLVLRIARHVLTGRIESPLLLSVVARAISIPVFLLGIYFVLRVAGLTQLALTVLGGTGLIGIIIGFAFRDIAENFLASLLLSMRNPFSGGDLIEVAGHTGIVQNLNTRSTVLLTLDGNHVQIPNATVFKSTIKNYSSIPSRRAEFMVGIGYDSSVSLAQRLIGEVLNKHPAVLDQPEPLVLVDQLGDATINLRIFYWFDSVSYSPAKINSALLRQTKNALLQGGIEMPDPAREVVFPKGVPIVQMDAAPRQTAESPVARSAQPPPEESSDATAEEGDLSSESKSMEHTEGRVPESEINLLNRR
ncbi:MAG: mechanosensitive ion channel family protein [Devosia marina]|uniref:mechanosensitive ion channel family protein n=1 Tax=Devosia marina TaxID=2683198 RepID=UPI0032EECE3F